METDLKKIFGKKIRHLRKLQDVTQMDLARALGMTSSGAISQVENGTKGLAFENVGKAAMFFGVHPCELLSSNHANKDDLALLKGVMQVIANKKTSKNYEAIQSLLKDN
jgi:transcriptional regulator with XRE-family HTH domain